MSRISVVGFLVLGMLVLPGANCNSNPNLPLPQSSAVVNPSTTAPVTGSGVTVNDSEDFETTQPTQAMLNRINHLRRAKDLETLTWDQVAAGVATVHTNDMVARYYFSLVSPEGIDLFTRLSSSNPPSNATAAQYFIIQGSQSVGEVWDFIRNNASTDAMLQMTQWRHVGIGYNPADGGVWTFLFTN